MAITQNYVDFGAGDDATGDGSVGTPWKTLQHAFDNLTRNITDGNQVNLKAGTAHVNSAALSLTTFIAGGALSLTAPLIIRGYTSAANDRGVGEIDASGAAFFAANTYDFIVLADLEIHNFGNNHGIYLDQNATVFHCEVHRGASTPSSKALIYVSGAYATVVDCYIHDPGTTGAPLNLNGAGCFVAWNTLELGNGNTATGLVTGNAHGLVFLENIILCNDASQSGVVHAGGSIQHFVGNTVVNQAAGTGSGIYAGNVGGRNGGVLVNNLVQGWSGAGGVGIRSAGDVYLLGWNAFYNNTTNVAVADQTFIDLTGLDDALAATPFVNVAGDNLAIDGTQAGVTEDAFPATYWGLAATTNAAEKGAVQAGAGSSGGGRPAFGDRTGGKY